MVLLEHFGWACHSNDQKVDRSENKTSFHHSKRYCGSFWRNLWQGPVHGKDSKLPESFKPTCPCGLGKALPPCIWNLGAEGVKASTFEKTHQASVVIFYGKYIQAIFNPWVMGNLQKWKVNLCARGKEAPQMLGMTASLKPYFWAVGCAGMLLWRLAQLFRWCKWTLKIKMFLI